MSILIEQQTPSDIRQAIFDRLNTVANVGKVQLYQRYAKNNSGLKDFYVWANPNNDDQEEIRGWFIRRETWRQDLEAGCYEQISQWRIQGFMTLSDDDKTELQFDNLLDEINQAFKNDGTLGGVVTSIGDVNEQGLQLQDSGPYMFSGVLCHGAKFRLITRGN